MVAETKRLWAYSTQGRTTLQDIQPGRIRNKKTIGGPPVGLSAVCCAKTLSSICQVAAPTIGTGFWTGGVRGWAFSLMFYGSRAVFEGEPEANKKECSPFSCLALRRQDRFLWSFHEWLNGPLQLVSPLLQNHNHCKLLSVTLLYSTSAGEIHQKKV